MVTYEEKIAKGLAILERQKDLLEKARTTDGDVEKFKIANEIRQLEVAKQIILFQPVPRYPIYTGASGIVGESGPEYIDKFFQSQGLNKNDYVYETRSETQEVRIISTVQEWEARKHKP